jgi:hypothetical protein
MNQSYVNVWLVCTGPKDFDAFALIPNGSSPWTGNDIVGCGERSGGEEEKKREDSWTHVEDLDGDVFGADFVGKCMTRLGWFKRKKVRWSKGIYSR